MSDRIDELRDRLRSLSEDSWLRHLPGDEVDKLISKLLKVNGRLEQFRDRNNRGVPMIDEDYDLWKQGYYDER